MDYRSKLVILAGLGCSPAFAFYVTPSIPEVFKTVGGVGYLSISPSDTNFANGIRSKITANLASAGGGAKIPVAYRFAVGAGRAAAAAAFGWPGLFLGIGAAVAYSYYQSHGFSVQDGIWVKNPWPGGYKYTVRYGYGADPMVTYESSSKSALCVAVGQIVDATYRQRDAMFRDNGWTYTGSLSANGLECRFVRENGSNIFTKTISTVVMPPTVVPVTRPEFEETMAPSPIPLGVPQAWPLPSPFWWPVQSPIVSPSPVNPADPMADPVPVPYRQPLGDPVPIPNTNPQQYKSPVIDIFPSPTVDDPWRVDVQPKDIISTSPDPIVAEPLPDPIPDPDTTETPTEPSDLCLLHPEILACQIVDPGTLDPVDVPDEARPMSITPDGGWGPNSGSCPAPKTATIMGVSISMPFTMLCDFAVQIKPLLIAFAWLSAALTFFGFAKRD